MGNGRSWGVGAGGSEHGKSSRVEVQKEENGALKQERDLGSLPLVRGAVVMRAVKGVTRSESVSRERS